MTSKDWDMALRACMESHPDGYGYLVVKRQPDGIFVLCGACGEEGKSVTLIGPHRSRLRQANFGSW